MCLFETMAYAKYAAVKSHYPIEYKIAGKRQADMKYKNWQGP